MSSMTVRVDMAATWIVAAVLLLGAAGGAVALAPEAHAGKSAKRVEFGKRLLKPGMRGKDVRVLQKFLTRLKLPTPKVGHYGKLTYKNVRTLERRRRWEVDGRVQRRQARWIKKMVERQRALKRARQLQATGYVFPVGDPHNFGGPSARFGAPRSGHTHQGQDVFAPCGTPMYAAHSGTVKVSAYQASGAGQYMVIDGVDGTDTAYMHLGASWVGVGAPLSAGQLFGTVGQSGNASGCHLHFEHWTGPGWYDGGYPIDPLPELLYWDSYS